MPDQNHSEALVQARIDISRLELQVDHLTAATESLSESNRQLTAKLDQVLLALSEARGGWRVLMAVGGAAGTIGAAVTWFFQHFTK